MFCNNCGKEIADNSKFCMYCGVQLSDNENIKDNTQSSKDEIRVVLDQVNVKIDKDNSHLSSISNSSKAFRKKWSRTIKRIFYAIAVMALFFTAIVIGTEIYEEIDYNIKCKQKQELEQANTLKRMVLVEGGSFNMGEGGISWKNSHKVELSDYYISIYEVTQGECSWGDGIPSKDIGANKPVVNISWYECVKYCNRRSIDEGLEQCYLIDGAIVELLPNKNGYRLPTEAEWEYAAKGGKLSKGYNYSGSNELSDVAWYEGCAQATIYNVGKKQPNELGIYDMNGNVWEWCWDGYSQYSTEQQTNPLGDDSSLYKVIRGGGYSSDKATSAINMRSNLSPDVKYHDIGFRLVRGIKK